ncbi:MAG: phenylalanine--tRNA ligase subunit beta [Pyrinomonadaceae bacterium]
MNISYNWLKDLIDIDLSPDELGKKLTNVGLAVEGIHALGNDRVFDIDLTSNRPDCLSHLGVAREIAVITKAETRPVGSVPLENPVTPGFDPQPSNLVTVKESDLCHRFTARVIRNVKIGPSPQWLVDRLEAIGERSINNVADITNYVMHEIGQPMHSFDLDKLEGQRIVVRRAVEGETITTLDEVERNLTTDMLAICDAEKPVAVAGVMGGLDSSITNSTSSVLLEVAHFKRESVRATSRKLGLATEASYRFERGVDIEKLIAASNRATELICDLAGGEAADFVDVYPTNFVANEIASGDISAAVKRLTGLNIKTDECIRILTALGIKPKIVSKTPNAKSRIFKSPSWRHDIHIEEDLVEEISRHAGYENIANELPPAYGAGEYQGTEIRKKLLRQTLVGLGFDEAISYSFINIRYDRFFETITGLRDTDKGGEYVTLQDSVIEGSLRMRPTILPGLLDAVRLNLNHQRRDLKLFEIGRVFAAKVAEDSLPNEREIFSLVITGGELMENRAMQLRDADFYDAKGAVEAALSAIGIQEAVFQTADVRHLRKGQSAVISVNKIKLGIIGRLNDEISATYKFKQPIYVSEIDLQAVFESPLRTTIYRPLAKYPAIIRDVSLVAKRDVEFSAIRCAVTEQNFELCRNVGFVDIYEGNGLADGERSITIRLEYRSDERTLVEDEVEAIHQQIVSKIEQQLPVKRRFG